MSKIVPFVMCIFLVQAPLSFTESRSGYNENDMMQDSMYEKIEELITQDELLAMLQDSHFQSKLQAHFQKMLQDLTLQGDELEPKFRSALQSALQNTFLEEFLEGFFTGMQNAFEGYVGPQRIAFFNEMQSIIQDLAFKEDILAVLQDPVIQTALQTNLQDLEFQRALQNSLQNDKLLHSMIQMQLQSVIQEDRLLSIIQNVLQDPRWPVIK